MNIIILQGPNLNLLGSKSLQLNKKITLDKLNRTIKNHIRNTNNKLKFSSNENNLVLHI